VFKKIQFSKSLNPFVWIISIPLDDSEVIPELTDSRGIPKLHDSRFISQLYSTLQLCTQSLNSHHPHGPSPPHRPRHTHRPCYVHTDKLFINQNLSIVLVYSVPARNKHVNRIVFKGKFTQIIYSGQITSSGRNYFQGGNMWLIFYGF
jgi:hypothetical protein